MCAFIDELVDVFSDDDAELGTRPSKNLHPYLPKISSGAIPETLHPKLAETQVADASHDKFETASSEATSSPREPRQYLPSPTFKHHRYLPLPKASEEPTEECNHEKVQMVSDTVASVDRHVEAPTAAESQAKLFRPPSSGMLHKYLFQSSQDLLDTAPIADGKLAVDVPIEKHIDTASEGRASESRVEESREVQKEKLDIDALIAALPSEVVEPKPVFIEKVMAEPNVVLQANPELHASVSSFLGSPVHVAVRADGFSGSELHFRVPVR
jgi:hypothetical protein